MLMISFAQDFHIYHNPIMMSVQIIMTNEKNQDYFTTEYIVIFYY